MLTARVSNLLQNKRLLEVKLLSTSLLSKGQDTDAKYLQQCLVKNSQYNLIERFSEDQVKKERCLAGTMTHVFSHLLKPVDQRLIIAEMDQIIGERYRSLGKSLCLGYFFKSTEKLKYFGSSFELNLKHELLKDL